MTKADLVEKVTRLGDLTRRDGEVIVETIFALPGIGRLLVGAIYTRDLIILQGVVLLVAAGFVVMNFIVDLLYAVLDPRIRHGLA